MLYDKHRSETLECVHPDITTVEVQAFCQAMGYEFYALGCHEDRNNTEVFSVSSQTYPARGATICFSKVREWKDALDAVGARVTEGGTYRHYKGGSYTTICQATVEATGKPVMVYRSEDGRIWTRPLDEFFGVTHNNGTIVPRFRFVPSA